MKNIERSFVSIEVMGVLQQPSSDGSDPDFELSSFQYYYFWRIHWYKTTNAQNVDLQQEKWGISNTFTIKSMKMSLWLR